MLCRTPKILNPSDIRKEKTSSRQHDSIPAKKRLRNSRDFRFSPLLASTDLKDYKVEDSKWDISNADLFLRVKDSLFPVHRSRIALSSPILRAIIVSVGYYDETATIVSIGELDVYQMQKLLDYIYYPRKKIKEETFDLSLFLAEEFMIEDLKSKCEKYLITCLKMNPMEQIVFANKHNMVKLLKNGIKKTIESVDYERHPLFEDLDPELQKMLSRKDRQLKSRNRSSRLLDVCTPLQYNGAINYRKIHHECQKRRQRNRKLK